MSYIENIKSLHFFGKWQRFVLLRRILRIWSNCQEGSSGMNKQISERRHSTMKAWKKPIIITQTESQLFMYINAAAYSGQCPTQFR